MKVSIRIAAVLALVALLVPAAAGAKEAEVTGPAALAGKGFFGGELSMAMADGQRPVKIAGRLGYVGFLDLGGDLKVRCSGHGRAKKAETEQGTVYLCKGRGGQAAVLGSHFKFRGFARHYRVLLPAGVRGTFHGRFVLCEKGPSGEAETRKVCSPPAADERPAKRDEARERIDPRRDAAKEKAKDRTADTPSGSDEDEEIPTIEELAELLGDK